jgi:branched-chain amino acid transport system permease protein
MAIATVFALSYNLLLGQTGLLSFGHAVYFGLGGFAAIHLMRAINAGLGLPMPLVPLAGAAAGLFFGMLFGSLTTRRGGVVFALISLGVGELVFAALRLLHGWSGGEEGLTANRAAPARVRAQFRVAAAGLLHHRILDRRRGLADVCIHPHAGGTHVQCHQGQP